MSGISRMTRGLIPNIGAHSRLSCGYLSYGGSYYNIPPVVIPVVYIPSIVVSQIQSRPIRPGFLTLIQASPGIGKGLLTSIMKKRRP